ncbi:MAG: tyrosine-type recombinase/integrase [Bacteroidia bacterium]|nr:tyrosine-type recombinase/integrase [Bacteroidia bacterium]
MRKKQTTTSGMDWNTMIGLTQRLKKDELFRDYLLITIGCYFGLRIGDLLSIKWSDLIGKNEFVIIEQKTKKNRRITINPNVIKALDLVSNELRLKNKFNENDYVFANRWGDKITISYINKRLKFIFKKYNVSVMNASSHTLRKTFGKRVYESDAKSERSLIYLSEIFSHSSISTTRRYIGITQEQIADMYLSL